MKAGRPNVCGGHHRVAWTAMLGEVTRYRKTTALLAATFGAGVGLAGTALTSVGRLVPPALDGSDPGLVWRSEVQAVATTRQMGVDRLSALLLWVAVLTLAVAAVTVFALCLAREHERAPELVVRRAVGAARRTLRRSALMETALILAGGLLLGTAAGVGVGLAVPPWPGPLRAPVPGPTAVAIASLAAVVLLGVLLPVILPRRKLGEAEPPSRAPLAPTALQIGATLVVLTMASLLSRHLGDTGAAHAVAAGDARVSSLDLSQREPEARASHYSGLLRRAEREGNAPTSLTGTGTLLGLGPVSMVTTDCGRCSEGGLPLRWRVKAATHHFVSADTFEMMGVKVLQGRGLTDGDDWSAPRVAVVNRSLAGREFQDGQAVGRRIRVVDDGEHWSTVVGVVDDPPAVGLGAALQPPYQVYLSVLQHPPATVDVTTIGGGGRPLAEIRAAEAAPLRWFAGRFREQGWAMLGVALVGAVAMVRLWVRSLLVELGVHRALGATRRRILLFVLVRAALVSATGIAAGLWFGAAAWGTLGAFVTGLQPWDQATVLRLGTLLMAATLLAALQPAWRAARAAPASLLSES